MSASERPESRLFFSPSGDEACARMLQLGLSERPVDALLQRLDRSADSAWLDRGIEAVLARAGTGREAMLAGKAAVAELRTLKDAAKAQFESAPEGDGGGEERLAALAVYLFTIAAAYLHHRTWISGMPRFEVAFHLSEVAEAVAEPWRSFLVRACEALRGNA